MEQVSTAVDGFNVILQMQQSFLYWNSSLRAGGRDFAVMLFLCTIMKRLSLAL